MKKIFFALVIAVAATVAISAQATSLHPDTFALRSQLTSFNVDPQLELDRVIGGEVVVNKSTRLVRLELVLGCPDNVVVCKEIARVERVELPLIRITHNGFCGATVYHARLDRRPVDGALQVLRVEDLNTIKCKIAIDPRKLTRVQYKTSYHSRMEKKEVKTLSKFEGRSLAGGK